MYSISTQDAKILAHIPLFGEFVDGATLSQTKSLGLKDTQPGHEDLPIGFGAFVLRVSWLAILLGIAIQILLLIVAGAFGHVYKINPLIASLAQTICWSTLVCVGIAVGTAASRLRLELMGLAGLLSGPLAFAIARSVARGVSAALGLQLAGSGGPSPLVLGIIKAVEYGCLAVAVGWIATRKKGGALAHALAGLCVGVFFGGIVLAYLYMNSVKAISSVELLSRGINEVVFPVGCSLVLFGTVTLGKHWKPAST